MSSRIPESPVLATTLVLSLLLGACGGSDDKEAAAADPRAGATVWAESDQGNGHAYRVVNVKQGITWVDAKAAAAAGGGHLATLTSAAESAFVTTLAADNSAAWLLISPDAAAGVFLGPWLGASAESARFTWVTSESWSYTEWAPGEPSGSHDGRVEDKLLLIGATNAGVFHVDGWNDAADFAGPGYVVEFDDAAGSGHPGGETPQTGDYFSCDTVFGEGVQASMHTCLEVSQEGIYLPSVKESCVAAGDGYTGAPGQGFSTTEHCSEAQAGCLCTYTENGGEYRAYTYATTVTTDPRANTEAYCATVSDGVVTCFGGAQ